MGGELSAGLLPWCAFLGTLPCSEAAGIWAVWVFQVFVDSSLTRFSGQFWVKGSL